MNRLRLVLIRSPLSSRIPVAGLETVALVSSSNSV